MPGSKFSSDIIDELQRLRQLDEQRRKQATQQQAQQQISDIDFYGTAANLGRNRDPRAMSEIEDFVHRGDWRGLEALYGKDVANQVRQRLATEGYEATQDALTQRSAGQAAVDMATAFPQSVAGMGFGILGAAGGILDPNLGTAIAQGGQAVDDWFGGMQSERLHGARRLHRARMAADEQEHRIQMEDEIAAGGSSILAQAKRVGKDALAGILSNMQDPTLLAQGTADAVASMLVAGGTTSILRGLGSGIFRTQRNRILQQLSSGQISQRAAQEALEALEKKITSASFGAAVGMMEGGGAYQDTALDIMSRSHDELARKSAPYREKLQELVKGGMDAEQAQKEAQRWLANRAGLVAGGLQGTAGAIVSRMAMGGAQPLKLRPSPRGMVAALGRDTVEEAAEEATQGLTGALAQNIALQRYVDPDQELLEGVGAAVGEGGIFGALSVGALRGPGAAARAPGRALSGLQGRRERSQQHREESQTSALVARSHELTTTADPDLQTFHQAIDKMEGVSPEQKDRAKRQLAEMVGVLRIEGPTEVQEMLSPELQSEVAGFDNRIDAILKTAELLLRSKDPEDQFGLAAHLSQLRTPLVEYMADPAFLEGILADSEAEGVYRKYMEVIHQHHELPRVKRALLKADELFGRELTPAEKKALADADYDSPLGKKAVQKELGQALLSPGKGDIEATRTILQHARDGKLNLSATELAALRGSLALLRARQAVEKAKAGKQITERHLKQEQVSQEITVGKGRGPKMPSALLHVQNVISAMQAGNTELGKFYLEDLGLFVQHMQNKVGALNESVVQGGKRVPYMQLVTVDGQRQWLDSSTNPNQKYQGLFVERQSQQSVAQAKMMADEARFLYEVYSGLLEAFPELEAAPVPLVQLELNPQQQQQAPVEPKTEPREDKKQEKKKESIPKKEEPQPKKETEVEEKVEDPTPAEPEAQPKAVVQSAQKIEPKARPEVKGIFPTVAERVTNMLNKVMRVRLVDGEPATRTLGMGAKMLPTIRKAARSQADLDAHLDGHSERAYRPEIAKEYRKVLDSDPKVRKILQDTLNRARNLRRNKGESLAEFERRKDEILERVQNVGALMVVMHANLQAKLRDKSKKDGRTLGERFVAGEALERWGQLKALNIAEVHEGKVRYHPELFQGAVLAGMQWWLTMSQRESTLHDDDLRSITGLEDVPNQLANLLNQGMGEDEATRSLAQVIARFWSLQGKKDQDLAYAEGIASAVAGEVLRAMVTLQMLEKVTVDVGSFHRPPIKKTVNRYRARRKHGGENPIYAYPSVIEEMVVRQPEQVSFYGPEAKIPIASHQLGNPKVKTTKRQHNLLRNRQQQQYHLNLEMAAIYDHLDAEGLVELFSDYVEHESGFNRNHLEAIEGRNLQIIGAYQEYRQIRQELENLSEKTGQPIEQIGKRYAYAISSVNRPMMVGRYNPQSNKVMRELFLPTWATLDLESSEHDTAFHLALAQALDFGVKLNKTSQEEVVRQTKELVEGKLAPAVDLLVKWRKDKGHFPIGKLKQALQEAGVTVSPLALHALVDLARLKEGADPKSFRTALYLEADGTTNGPFNTLGLLVGGEFSVPWIENIAKGGVSLGSTPRTADQLMETAQADLYETTTGHAQRRIASMIDHMESQPEGQQARKQVDSLYGMLDLLGLDVNLIQGEDGKPGIELKRGAAKSPMTVTVYGSGEQGIANQVGREVQDAFYEKLSQGLQAQKEGRSLWDGMFPGDPDARQKAQQLFRHLDDLTGKVAGYSRKKESYFLIDYHREGKPSASKRIQVPADFASFTLNQQEVNNLQRNLKALFVSPVREAIFDTLGKEVDYAAGLIRDSSQIQSLVLRQLYLDRIQQKLEEKGLNPEQFDWKAGDFLSQMELDEIWEGLQKEGVVPQMVIDGQPFLLTKESVLEIEGKSGRANRPEFSRALDGSFRTPANVRAPDNAGVSAIPKLVQGLGDGRMIREIFQQPMEGALDVYDGVNLPLDKLAEYGPQMNRGALAAWSGNLFEELGDSFHRFLGSDPVIAALRENDQLAVQVAESLRLFRKGDQITPAQARGLLELKLQQLGRELDEQRLSVGARQMVLSQTSKSIDQMASVSTPHVTEQRIDFPPDATPEQIQRTLNEEYHRARKHLQKNKPLPERPKVDLFKRPAKKTPAAHQPQKKAAPQPVEIKFGRKHRSGVRVLGKTAIDKMVRSLDVTDHEKQVVLELLRSQALDGWQIVAGDPVQVQAYQDSRGSPTPIVGDKGQAVLGATDPQSKTIYLLSTETETVVHELVHAATYASVRAVYEGQDLGPRAEQIKAAVSRLERLLELFRETVFDTEGDVELERSLQDATDAMLRYETDFTLTEAERKAGILNEFMAWTLSNRALAEQLALADVPVQEGKLARITKAAFQAIKKLIWGRKHAPKFGTDVLSQIRFNTAILARARPTLGEVFSQSTLQHATSLGSSELAQTRQAFQRKIVERVQGRLQQLSPQHEASMELYEPLRISGELAREATQHFRLTEAEESTFRMIVAALTTEAQFAPQALVEASRLYAETIKSLDAADFVADEVPKNTREFEEQKMLHESKVDFLLGQGQRDRDGKGRSTLLPVFLALALTSPELRRALGRKTMPGAKREEGRSLDVRFANLGHSMMEGLSNRFSGLKQPATIKEALDQLSQTIVEQVTKEQEQIERQSLTEKVNDYLVRVNERLGEAAYEKAQELQQSDSAGTKAVGTALKAISLLASEEKSELVAMEVMNLADRVQLWNPLRELVHDLVGRTEQNANVYDMAKRVKATVARMRQDFREKVPHVIRSKFKVQPTEQQWDLLYRSLGRYDVASLAGLRTNTKDVLKLLADPKAIAKESKGLEAKLKKAHPPSQWNLIDQKIDQLVEFTRTGKAGPNLLANAFAISRLYGEKISTRWKVPGDEVVEQIDQLITLRLLASLDPHEQKQLAQLVEHEAEGVGFLYDYLKGQRATELAKAQGPAKINHFKGMLPQQLADKGHLIVIEDREAAHYEALGYRKVGDYRGSNIELGRYRKSYYYSPEMRRTVFSQGIVQNVDFTAYGVHEHSGHSTGITAGIIRDPIEVKKLQGRMHRERAGTENLRPIYNDLGVIVAFERMVDPEYLKLVQQPQDLAKMVGQWRGRQIEEELAREVNRTLIGHLREMYDTDLRDDPQAKDKYVDLFVSEDPVIQDAVRLFSPQFREMIQAAFPDGFYVRKSMVNDVIGYRQATVGDLWTGNTRLPPKLQEGIREVLEGILGKDAYQKMVAAERNIQGIVHAAKTNIVVRSVLIPAVNLTSNYLQLVGRGMSPVQAAKLMAAKTAEIHTYAQSLMRQVELQAELRAAEGNPLRNQKIQAELKSIEDMQKRLSIWPLIQAGEFSTIADLGTAAEDLHLSSGNVVEYLTRKVDELPPGPLRNLARMGYVAKDTSLFVGLQKAVQYGDFIAKAALYDHYTKKKKMSSKKALGKITEEFVNYDVLPGRTRNYLENMGILWFYNYKLRSLKVGLSMMRSNPLQALMGGFMSYPFGIGTPVTEHVFAKLFQGTLGYSVGPGMLSQGLELHPVYSLVLD